MNVLPSLCVAVGLASWVVAQTDEEYQLMLAESEHRRATALANAKAGKPMIPFEWRRNAASDLEFKAPWDKKAEFAPWFAEGIVEAVGATGIVGLLMLPAHNGDVLSLTHGEHHLRRIGIASTTPDLAKFVRSPLPEQLRDLALLDRMVAIDLLARRGDGEAKAAHAAIAADATLAAPLRERAAAVKPARRRLDPATLALPANCHLVVVFDHAELFDALPLVEMGFCSGLVSTMAVIQMLKMPEVSDYVLGQSESEFVTGLPFEVARRLGNFRLDQTAIVLGSAGAPADSGLFVASAGSFAPTAVVGGVPSLGIDGATAKLADATATADLAGTELVVTESLATARPAGVAVAPRPELTTQLLAGGVGCRVHVPTASWLLAQVEAAGIAGVKSIDATLSCGDPVMIDATLRTKDEASAVVTAKQVKDQVLRMGPFDWISRVALEWQEDERRTVAVAGNEVRIHIELPRANLITPEMLRERLVKEHLR